jgi:hypothetical protein
VNVSLIFLPTLLASCIDVDAALIPTTMAYHYAVIESLLKSTSTKSAFFLTNWSGLDLTESGAARSREAKGRQLWLECHAAVSKIGDEADACREAVRTGV